MSASDFLPYLGWIILACFVLGALGIAVSFQTTRLKIKNGYPLEGMWGQSLKPGSDKQMAERVTLLTQENAQLRAELGSMKDRLATVERIVTDSGYAIGHEIEALRLEQRESVR
ncbi:hypothetical protein EYB45_10550 [Erythrobacteraceae bacterium CFH 75059]|uniref:hypothetical protein n=1 Tax=Qipengyuania thermophila TaxID=2509361 RepID=UPI00101EA9CF|nr:hypothetical protein [Qipengyuania thermophila]TCD01865.1 hypothetical protein EYB45_10550 [Erythrobacteraceae bacterium CFH 75059]